MILGFNPYYIRITFQRDSRVLHINDEFELYNMTGLAKVIRNQNLIEYL